MFPQLLMWTKGLQIWYCVYHFSTFVIPPCFLLSSSLFFLHSLPFLFSSSSSLSFSPSPPRCSYSAAAWHHHEQWRPRLCPSGVRGKESRSKCGSCHETVSTALHGGWPVGKTHMDWAAWIDRFAPTTVSREHLGRKPSQRGLILASFPVLYHILHYSMSPQAHFLFPPECGKRKWTWGTRLLHHSYCCLQYKQYSLSTLIAMVENEEGG